MSQFHVVTVFLFLLPFLPTIEGNLNFYVGYGDQNDDHLKAHYMYNRSIGVYHRRQPDSMKFCLDKSAGFHAMGLCKNFYAYCDDDHTLTITVCSNGRVYRGEEEVCVERELEPRCSDVQYALDHPLCEEHGNQELVAVQDCSRTYGVCYGGSIYFVECLQDNRVFSASYGACIPRRDHPSCPYHSDQPQHPHPHHSTKLEFSPVSSMCKDPGEQGDYEMYFGPCNRRHLLCSENGYSFVGQCPDEDAVADRQLRKCVHMDQSSVCPANWPEKSGEEAFVEHMNEILKSTEYCKTKPNGMFTDPYSECKREIIFCFEGEGTFHVCPPGTGIDEKGWCSQKDSCWWTENDQQEKNTWKSSFLTSFASHAELCQKTETDGIHVFGLCQKFYGRCHLGKFEIQICQEREEVFDPEQNRCVPQVESKQCKVEYDEKKEEEHSHQIHPINRCSSTDWRMVSKLVATGQCQPTFLVCVNGWEVQFSCENREHVFHEEHGVCVPKMKHQECPEYQFEATSTTRSSTTTKRQYECQGDGAFHVHESDCTKFYRCAHGRMVEMSCPVGTAFDQSIDVCNHKHMVDRCKEMSTESEEGLF